MPSTMLLSEQRVQKPQSPKPLEEDVWNAWLNRNGAEDRRNHAFRMEAVRWGCIGLLLLAAGLSFQHAFAYPLLGTKVFQFALTLGAIAFAWQTTSSRRYVLALAFTSVAVLFQPLLPSSWLFQNSPVLLLSTLPFIVVAYWGEGETKTTPSSSEVLHAK
jgi:hypothetical protein